jgi:hypothetical protein
MKVTYHGIPREVIYDPCPILGMRLWTLCAQIVEHQTAKLILYEATPLHPVPIEYKRFVVVHLHTGDRLKHIAWSQ